MHIGLSSEMAGPEGWAREKGVAGQQHQEAQSVCGDFSVM